MRRLAGVAALMMVAGVARAQDTTVVVVRHLPAQQDTGVVVRHIAPAPMASAPQQVRTGVPYAAPRYGLRSAAVYAKDPNLGTSLSFLFPGGGQYYAGNMGKGLALTFLGIGAPIIGYANVTRQNVYYSNGAPLAGSPSCYAGYPGPASAPGAYCRARYDWTPAAIGLGVGITAWLYGIATAGSDVQHWNQAHGVRFVNAPGRVGFAVVVP